MPELLLPQMFDRFRNAKDPQEALRTGDALLFFLYAMQGEGLTDEARKLIDPLTSYMETIVSHLGESPERVRQVYEAQAGSAAKSDSGWLKDFDESQHPRDERGRFTEAGGGLADKQQELPLSPKLQKSDWGKAEDILAKSGFAMRTVNSLPDSALQNFAEDGHKLTIPSGIERSKMETAKAFGEALGLVEKAGIDTITKTFPVMFGNFDPDSAALATINSPDENKFFVINTHFNDYDFNKPEQLGFTLGYDRAYDLYQQTGDAEEAAHEMLKWAAVHEIGHALDFLSGNKFSQAVLDIAQPYMVMAQITGDERPFADFVARNMGGYGLQGGPLEASAELFTKMIAGELPPEMKELEKVFRGKS